MIKDALNLSVSKTTVAKQNCCIRMYRFIFKLTGHTIFICCYKSLLHISQLTVLESEILITTYSLEVSKVHYSLSSSSSHSPLSPSTPYQGCSHPCHPPGSSGPLDAMCPTGQLLDAPVVGGWLAALSSPHAMLISDWTVAHLQRALRDQKDSLPPDRQQGSSG